MGISVFPAAATTSINANALTVTNKSTKYKVTQAYDPEFEGLIPKGTPIAQVIPFKRESWTMQFGRDKEIQEQSKITANLNTKFFDRYKTMFRKNKEYK